MISGHGVTPCHHQNCVLRSLDALHLTSIFFVPDPQTHGPHGPTCKRTDGHTDGRTDGHAEARMDTQKHGRTRRRADGHAEARTQKHGCRSTDADADADTWTQMQAPDGARTLNIRASSAWVEKSSRRRTRLDERTRTFEVYYIAASVRFATKV